MTFSHSTVELTAYNLAAAWLVAAAYYMIDRTSLPEPGVAFVAMTVVGGVATALQRSGVPGSAESSEPATRASRPHPTRHPVPPTHSPYRQAEPAPGIAPARRTAPVPDVSRPDRPSTAPHDRPPPDRPSPDPKTIDWASYTEAPSDELQCRFCGGFDTSPDGTCAVCGSTTATIRTEAVVVKSWLHREPGD